MLTERIRTSFLEGIAKVKWFSAILSERVKVEVAVIKLLREAAELEKKRTELVAKVGERVFELRPRGEINVFEDTKVMAVLKEMDEIDARITDLKAKVSQIGEAEE